MRYFVRHQCAEAERVVFSVEPSSDAVMAAWLYVVVEHGERRFGGRLGWREWLPVVAEAGCQGREGHPFRRARRHELRLLDGPEHEGEREVALNGRGCGDVEWAVVSAFEAAGIANAATAQLAQMVAHIAV